MNIDSINSPLIVDYHETPFLDQVNKENREKTKDSRIYLPPVPINALAFDRYSFVSNNPLKYIDPTGHKQACADGDAGGGCGYSLENAMDLLRESRERDREKENGFSETRKYGEAVAGASLIILTDVFLGLPLAFVVVSTGGVSPPAVAAEIIEVVVVLPLNILGIYLIYDSTQK